METHAYKSRLEDMLAELTEELNTIGIHDPHNPANWIERFNDLSANAADPNDVADRTEEYDERRATLAVLETRFNNVTKALKKIEDGTYGICDVCGEQIENARLDANPAAATCETHMENESALKS